MKWLVFVLLGASLSSAGVTGCDGRLGNPTGQSGHGDVDSYPGNDSHSDSGGDSHSGPDSDSHSGSGGDSHSSSEPVSDSDSHSDSDSGSDADSGSASDTDSDVVLDANIEIDSQIRHQTIDGFGAALPLWSGSSAGFWTADEVHSFVGTGENELGLSIVRTIVRPEKSTWPYAVASLKESIAYGDRVRILASPWSPPVEWKTTNAMVGGELRKEHYGDYVDHLNDYIEYMAGQGVIIDVISVQNEPDIEVSYDSCEWSPGQIRDFVRDHGARIQGAKLMAAESFRYNPAWIDPTLNDSVASQNVDLLGGHLYGCEQSGYLKKYDLAVQHGKRMWMTEYLLNLDNLEGSIWGGDNQQVWNETLDGMALSIHKSMEVDWSAYIWWYGRRFYSLVGDGERGTTKGLILKRGWVFSHYSKFIRPGYARIGVDTDGSLGDIRVTAFDGDKQVVAVLLNLSNNGYSDVIVEIAEVVSSARAYVTTQDKDRAAIDVTPLGRYATVSAIEPRSIVTVVMAY
jgi:O-glycosyl hydrolase